MENRDRDRFSSSPATAQDSGTQAAEAREGGFPAWLLPVLVAALTFLVYLPSLRFQFIYDDLQLILGNPFVQSWHYLGTLFRTHMWAFGGPSYVPNYWRPLFMVWLLVNYTLFGAHPLGWHLMTVLLHVAVALLVYALAQRLTGESISAAGAALIFALHPATIEDTAWVLGATESMVAIFLLAALVLDIDGRKQQSRGKGWAAVALYAGGLLAKETAVALIPLIFLHAWLYSGQETGPGWGKRISGALRAIAPYLLVTAIYLPLRMLVLRSLAPPQNPATLAEVALTWPSLLWRYLRLLVIPTDMALYYDLPLVSRVSVGAVTLPLIGLTGVAAGVWWWARRTWSLPEPGGAGLTRGRLVTFASALILLPLLPVMYVRALIGGEFLHARYLHMSCVGFALLITAAAEQADFGRAKLFARPAPQVGILAAVVLLLAGLNVPQQAFWANDLILYAHGVENAPHNVRAITNLGSELNARERYEEAIVVLNRALAENRNSWRAHFNLGYAYAQMGRWAEAESHLERSVAIDTVNGEQYAYLAVADRNLGKLERAEWAARQALERKPRELRYHYSLGLILEQEGKRAEAAREFQAELELNPSDADAKAHLAGTK